LSTNINEHGNRKRSVLKNVKLDNYFGYSMTVFEFDGHRCQVVKPHQPSPNKDWVWKAEFFEAFPEFQLSMLKRGFYLVFMEMNNSFGCPDALKHWDNLYALLTGTMEFSPRPILFGQSRGGLYVYNWASEHTQQVGCIYADNPVCDFKSWPYMMGKTKEYDNEWQRLLNVYHFASEADALNYSGNPVDRLQPLIDAGIPLVHAVATDDEVVFASENTDVLEQRYRQLGGKLLKVFRHPGLHHPHGLADSTPLIEFILNNRKT
jgi:hypothetical protein